MRLWVSVTPWALMAGETLVSGVELVQAILPRNMLAGRHALCYVKEQYGRLGLKDNFGQDRRLALIHGSIRFSPRTRSRSVIPRRLISFSMIPVAAEMILGGITFSTNARSAVALDAHHVLGSIGQVGKREGSHNGTAVKAESL
ncbi:hypothetical protein BCR43DRAFT_118785 [Syncephalastrum racemosum]|uniref:Uncharacterized protein n=1 Tax=Syncephalastrum racemosum TaxID=13706 RepID=A0A1X2GZF4_SYNRA|nr:hypothetical protein BCR43DRAFT_118785 [Syncephalastrum racemosum]